MLVMHRLRGWQGLSIVSQGLDMGMFKMDRKKSEMLDNYTSMRRGTNADTFPMPGDKGIEAIHAEEIIPSGDWLMHNVVEVAQIG
jgi:hypothetical protein